MLDLARELELLLDLHMHLWARHLQLAMCLDQMLTKQ